VLVAGETEKNRGWVDGDRRVTGGDVRGWRGSSDLQKGTPIYQVIMGS
jgi:hypothetical protein